MLSLVLLLTTFTVPAQPPTDSVVFIVRHAERADTGAAGASMMKDDPDLSARGQTRAKSLAGMLRDVGIRGIYTSEMKRTQQTAAPLATAVGVGITRIPAEDVAALLEKLKTETGNILVVGHSNTIPKILAGLGIHGTVEIADNEYDNLFVVIGGTTPARLLRLRYE